MARAIVRCTDRPTDPLFTGLPKETVWKIDTGPILKSHKRADRYQQPLFSRLVLPETTFNEPSSYFPDSLSRNCPIIL